MLQSQDLSSRFVPGSGYGFNALVGGLNDNYVEAVTGLNNADRSNMVYNAYQVAQDRKFNSEQAQLNRDFQEYMSNTAYSRAVKDLKSVGVNPYAVISGLSSASTPAGSSAYSTSHSGSYTSGQSERNARISSETSKENSVRGLIGTVISGASSAFAAAIRAGLIV